MKYEFKQSALLGRGKAGSNSVGQIFYKGVHEVPEKFQKDPTFLHFVKHKLIVPFVAKKQEGLAKAESDFAKQSEDVAKRLQGPDEEIGGDEDAPSKPEKKGKGK